MLKQANTTTGNITTLQAPGRSRRRFGMKIKNADLLRKEPEPGGMLL